MKFEKEEIEVIHTFGALQYNNQQIADVLGVSILDIEKEFKNIESQLSKAYKKGKAMADFQIHSRLFDLAKTGDFKALEKLEDLRDENNRTQEE